jgi:hypothetical protein
MHIKNGLKSRQMHRVSSSYACIAQNALWMEEGQCCGVMWRSSQCRDKGKEAKHLTCVTG